MRVAILGAGLMGAQIGCEYALGGHRVVLHARDEEAARRRAEAGLQLVEREGMHDAARVAAARERLSVAGEPQEAAADADLLVESLPEELAAKASVLRRALEAAPEAVVATNTSSLSIGVLGQAIGAPERTVGTHYLNPPLLMPTVEVIAGAETGDEIVAFVRGVLVALGKLPILVRRDVPGFVWNRLQFALVRELAWLVENDVASREDLDVVVSEGLARRWRRVGPLRAIALGGTDTWNRAGANIVRDLSTARSLPDLATIAITDGDPVADTAARDRALAADLEKGGA